MKKIISLILALVMICALATTAFAADNTNPGSITIKGVAVTVENGVFDTVASYKVYKMLDIAGYTDSGLVSYKLAGNNWDAFFTDDDVAEHYLNVDPNNIVTFDTTHNITTSSAAEPLAAAAKAYADTAANSVTADYDIYTIDENTYDPDKGTANIVFENLPLGYYLIESDMGILCGLDTAAPHGEINAKNAPPTITKKVEEDSLVGSGTSTWGKVNTADIGQPISFDITIDVRPGAENYILHDKMEGGLYFDTNAPLYVYHLVSESGVREDLEEGVDYTLNTSCTDGCAFEIVFNSDTCKSFATNDKVIVLYTARLNDRAESGANPNRNSAWVQFGENHNTEPDITETYTYDVDIIKVDGTNGNLLKDAEFQLYYSTTAGSDPIQFVLTNPTATPDANYVPVYHIWSDGGHTNAAPTTTLIANNGKISLIGLDKATYYLKETKAPSGYNQLDGFEKIEVTNKDMVATSTDYSNAVVIENNAGAELPSTGAMGTTMFITFGMVVVLATGLLLVTKKRLSMIED